MASFFWQATFPISHIMWARGSMAQKFPCSLQSIVPCGLVMLWLGRHPIPSLPPPWQMLFPGMLRASKENVKLEHSVVVILPQRSLKETETEVILQSPHNQESPWEQGEAFLAVRMDERDPREAMSYRVHFSSSSSRLFGAMDHSPVQGLFKREKTSRQNYSFLLAPESSAKTGSFQPGVLRAHEALR